MSRDDTNNQEGQHRGRDPSRPSGELRGGFRPERFIADAMLGRLATWLRIIGCDVAYFRSIEDGDLIELALKEGRFILTRDTLLIRRRKAKGNSFLVKGNSYRDQLKQVVEEFSLDPYENLLARCVECNVRLRETGREEARGLVPEYVYETQDSFRRCPGCGRVYWPATHRDNVLMTLRDIFGR